MYHDCAILIPMISTATIGSIWYHNYAVLVQVPTVSIRSLVSCLCNFGTLNIMIVQFHYFITKGQSIFITNTFLPLLFSRVLGQVLTVMKFLNARKQYLFCIDTAFVLSNVTWKNLRKWQSSFPIRICENLSLIFDII